MVICTRRGCGVDFDASSSTSISTDPCVHHPGAPVFHEGLKSWSCCKDTNKPVLEFDQFIAISGCATAQGHSVEKQNAPTIKSGKVVDPSSVSADDAQASAAAPVASSSSLTQPLSGGALMVAANAQQKKAEKVWTEEKDAEDKSHVELAEGSKCKRSGCAFQHQGGVRERSKEGCSYHKGSPIFHEGSKGWSCCKRRVLDFNDFLAIKPCTTSESGHLFFGAPKDDLAGEPAGEEMIHCRMDHYETPNDIRLTVYAKAVETEKSSIKFDADAVHFSLLLPPASASSGRTRKFLRTLSPFAPIDAEASSFNITKFKVDLILVKAVKGQSWPALERSDKVVGYGLTFGRDKDK